MTVFTDTLSQGVGVAPGQVTGVGTTGGEGLGLAPGQVVGIGTTLTMAIGITPLPDPIKAVLPILAETVGVTLTQTTLRGLVLLEHLGLAPALIANQIAHLSLSDLARLSEALAAGIPATLTSGVGISLTQTVQQAALVIDALGLSDVLAGAASYHLSLAETVALASSFANFFGGALADGIGLAPVLAGTYHARPVLADGVGLSDAPTPRLVLRVIAHDTVEITPTQALQLLFAPTIVEGIALSAGYLEPNGSFITWVMNGHTHAVSEYHNFAFNSFAQVGHKFIAASDAGLYELDGDTDDGASIVARIKSGLLQFGGTHLARIKAAYLATRGAGDFVLKIETGDATYTYGVTTHTMRSTKVHMGKGQRARYFAFELISTGADFDLETLEFVPIVVQRRV